MFPKWVSRVVLTRRDQCRDHGVKSGELWTGNMPYKKPNESPEQERIGGPARPNWGDKSHEG
jgi:hypothetical protein